MQDFEVEPSTLSQLLLPLEVTKLKEVTKSKRSGADINQLRPEDRAAHDWYRFVLSYPPHLVREYLQKFRIESDHRVL
ncbi:MAG TPA: hypothetical protein VL134_03410, partial [Leptolyngbya sp.]|nr:hypothetical protein [Leptolyngbya sp.]